MNHCVPDFDIEMDRDEYPIPTASGLTRPKKPTISMPDDDIMELLWQNGQVVMQSQNQRPLKKSPAARFGTDGVIPAGPSTARGIRPSQQQEVENYHNQNLFVQEDEMASWLHYPIVDDSPLDHNFCAELLYSPPTFNNNNSTMQNPVRSSQVTELRLSSEPVVAPRPPIPPARTTEQAQTRLQNFAHFSKRNARVEAGPSSSKDVMRESTVVDSSETPAVAAAVSRISDNVGSLADPTYVDTGLGSMSTGGVAAPSTTSAGGVTAGRDAMTCEMTVTSSSPGGSSESDEPARKAVAGDRKRKGREPEESECQSEDIEFESGEPKRQVGGSTSAKRSRAAEVHNLSERRRRDRINEKMRALQELIPRCNKSDKASMLDEAIEYLKSLQLQVQMMSMGCGMVPMIFPGIQQYMASSMGMGLGMGMGMNRPPPVMPFSNMLAAPPLPTAATAHLGSRFPIPPFHMPPHVDSAADSSRAVQAAASSQSDPMLTSVRAPDPNQYSQIPSFADPYQQYLSPHQMPFQYIQNQAINQPNISKQNTSSRSHENSANHQAEGS